MLSLSFNKHDNEIMELILTDYLYSGQSYELYLTRTLKYLSFCINNDWEMLKNSLFINDEKVA